VTAGRSLFGQTRYCALFLAAPKTIHDSFLRFETNTPFSWIIGDEHTGRTTLKGTDRISACSRGQDQDLLGHLRVPLGDRPMKGRAASPARMYGGPQPDAL